MIRTAVRRTGRRRAVSTIDRLEPRWLLAADVTSYHNDLASTGVNNAETVLTRGNVNQFSFGKVGQFQVQGQVYAQPLVQRNVNITTGANAGVHDVVFVATEHDQLYAFDAGTSNGANSPNTLGQLLWQRNFLDIADANNHLPGATALTTVPQSDINSADITVEIGITSTPVIDSSTNTIYVLAKTKETVGGVAHWVQRIHAVNIQTGADRTSALIGDTTGTNTNNTPIWVYGNGDGHVTDPYNGTGRQVVQFNALRQLQRVALSLVNGVVYAGWASHGDNGPYHGWMVGWDETTLALKGVLNTTPNGGLGGIWMGGGTISFDGTYFYAVTGNGTFDGQNGSGTGSNPTAPAPGPITGLNAQGFPAAGDFGDSFIKIGLDPTSTATTQNANGWGLKVVDYFTPFNQAYMNAIDLDLGSSAPNVVPDYISGGPANQFASAARPKLLFGSGKEGVIYLLDRSRSQVFSGTGYNGSMGGFGLANNIVQNTANQLSGSFDTAGLFNGRMYYVDSFGGTAKTFTFANGAFSTTPETRSVDAFSFAGSTPSISSNGLSDGIVWDVDRGTNQLRAYSSDSYATELYTSAQALGGRDTMGAAVKFEVPTVVNGHVYVGAGTGDPNNVLVVYGLLPPPNAAPNAPTNLVGRGISNAQINLTWTNNATAPNLVDGFSVEQSSDGVTGWSEIAAGVQGTSVLVGGLATGTNYYFRVRGHDAVGYSGYAYTAAATRSAGAPHNIDYSSGFASSAGLSLNGGATVGGNVLHLTTAVNSQARSAFATTQQSITAFTTTFTYTKNGTADGAAFVIQRDPRGAAALGTGGGALGYGTPNQITPSLALLINIYPGHALGTEFVTNGTVDFNYTQSSINTSLNNTPITITLVYTGGVITARLVQGASSESKSFAVDLPALLGGSTAYVGFTAATGGSNATQDITSWTFDAGFPAAVPSKPDLTAASDSGASSSDDVTNDNTPTFTGVAAPGSTIALLVDGVSNVTTTAGPDGIYTITATALPDGTHALTAVATNVDGTSPASPALAVRIDTTPPALSSAIFAFDAPAQALTLNFTEDVTQSVQTGDLSLTNDTAGSTITPDKMNVVTDAGNARGTWTFPGYTNGALPDGNYTATVAAANVADLAGNAPAGPLTITFFVLAADANRDRKVDLTDFTILAANFNTSGRTFSQGNYDYDASGTVDLTDFTILASRFNQSLPAPTAALAAMGGSVLPAAPAASARSSWDGSVFAQDRISEALFALDGR